MVDLLLGVSECGLHGFHPSHQLIAVSGLHRQQPVIGISASTTEIAKQQGMLCYVHYIDQMGPNRVLFRNLLVFPVEVCVYLVSLQSPPMKRYGNNCIYSSSHHLDPVTSITITMRPLNLNSYIWRDLYPKVIANIQNNK